MSEDYMKYDGRKPEPPYQTTTDYDNVVAERDALAAENAKLREALNDILSGAGCLPGYSISDACAAADAALRDTVQPSEQWPVCSICRQRHGSEKQHPCE